MLHKIVHIINCMEEEFVIMHNFTQYVNPYLGDLLENIKLDKEYITGKDCYLYDTEGNEYLDCIANYGAVPFGYNPEEIWECITDVKDAAEPSLVKPSALRAAGDLAKRLIELAPGNLQYVTFTNSGTESVEAAIKLCRSTTGRKGILTTLNSFHGKTLGSLSATGNSEYQKDFCAPVEGFACVPYGDLEELEKELEKNPEFYAAFIIEPIQGEGGIVRPPAGYLKKAREICHEYGVLFVLDEVQTGLGRTGSLFACQQEGVDPDVMLLAKALGGGIMPIGACLSTEEVYNEEFANKHSSTFAGNTLACRIGLKVLDILTRDNGQIMKNIQENGKELKERLKVLHTKYPEIIGSVRGIGYMLGIEFKIDRNTFPGSLLGIMADQELLTPIISSYLLNKENIRVAPTLNGNNVIRIEPPLIMEREQCFQAVNAIENMLEVLQEGNTARFISYLIEADDGRDFPSYDNDYLNDAKPGEKEDEGRFAFLMHPIDLKNYPEFDNSLQAFSEEELRELTGRWNSLVEPFVTGQTRIKAASGKEVYGEFITVPYTTEQLLEMPKQEALDQVKAAIDLAKERGAEIVGLGAYTSVVTMGGLYVRNSEVPITTGNSFTVVAAVDAVLDAMEKLDTAPEESVTAIVGATGSIGKGAAMLMAQSVSKLLLIGNPNNRKSSIKRLTRIAGEIYQFIAEQLTNNVEFVPGTIGDKVKDIDGFPEAGASLNEFVDFAQELSENNPYTSPIIVSTEIEEMLPMADVTISATNTIAKFITPDIIKYGAVICDISRPKNVSEMVSRERPDVLVIDGGVIEVPGKPTMGWNFGFEKGLVYACMAETMLLALDKHYENTSIGSSGVNLESILYTRKLGSEHGFKLSELRSFDRPLSKEKWQQIISARENMLAAK